MIQLQQSVGTNFPIEILCTSGNSYVPGVTPTVMVRKNGAAAVAVTGTVTASDSYGIAYYWPSAFDVNTLGPLTLEISATGIDPHPEIGLMVVPLDPYAVPPTNLTAEIQEIRAE